MKIILTSEFFDELFTIAVLLTFGTYHLLIYLGQKWYNNAEKYHYYLSFTSFSIALYIFIQLYFDGLKQIVPFWFNRVPFEVIFGSGAYYGFVRFSSHVFGFPKNKQKIFRFSYILLFICLLLTVFAFIDYRWFLKHLFLPIVAVFALSVISSILIFLKWIISNKLFKDKIFIIISLGLILIIFNVLIIKAIISIDRTIQFSRNYFFVDIGILMITYALALKFNREHIELEELKENLEEKVRIRTYELDKAKHEVEDSSRQKTMFFINIAHETKTPLTLLSNFFERFIKKYGMTSELSVVKRNIESLKRNMVNFLDAEKLERGQVFYNHEQITCISELLTEKYLLFKNLAERKGIDFEYNITENLYIKADPFAIDRIVNNLIENALKYTNEGGKITVSLEPENAILVLKVTDNGVGIPEEKIKHIFKPYYQISHKKQNIDGIGMGMYIVKKIMDELDGKIITESETGKGTCFKLEFKNIQNTDVDYSNYKTHFLISAPDDVVSKYRAEPRPVSEHNTERHNILIVEDNEDMLNFIKTELEENYNIYTAINGFEALRELKYIPKPDIIISDIMMDKMDGCEFYEAIINIEAFRSVPFVFLTAKTSIDEKIEMLKKGAIDYLYKPFSIDELKAKIHTIIENIRKQQIVGLQEAINLISNQMHIDSRNNKNYKNTRWENFEYNCKKFNITERQKEIIKYISEGLEYKEIANILNISDRTVTRHIQNIFGSLNIHNKMDLVNLFFNQVY